MRRLTICMVLTLSLVPAAAADAKKPVSAKVCGPSDCRTVKDHDALAALTEGGPPTDPPKRGAGWYSVRTTIEIDNGRRDSFSTAIVPSAGLMRGSDATEGYVWLPATPAAKRVYRTVTSGLAPFPARTLEGVRPPKVRVEQVVRPADAPRPDAGGSSPLSWILGGVVVVALAGALLRWRGLPWPRPARG